MEKWILFVLTCDFSSGFKNARMRHFYCRKNSRPSKNTECGDQFENPHMLCCEIKRALCKNYKLVGVCNNSIYIPLF